MRDCLTMCFDICTINIRVSIRVRGLHLVNNDNGGFLDLGSRFGEDYCDITGGPVQPTT